jgi:hypothetical protein
MNEKLKIMLLGLVMAKWNLDSSISPRKYINTRCEFLPSTYFRITPFSTEGRKTWKSHGQWKKSPCAGHLSVHLELTASHCRRLGF